MKALIAALLLSTTSSFSPTVTVAPPRTFGAVFDSRLLSTVPEQAEPTAVPDDVTAPTATIATTAPDTTAVETPAAMAVESPAATGVETPATTTEMVDGAPVKKVMTSNQEKYGVSLELPETYVRCGRCATAFALKAEDCGARGRRVACTLCKHSWYQTPERLFKLNDGNELIPLPAHEVSRIGKNLETGRDPDFVGEIKFYVGNLDFGVTEEDLMEVFGEKGAVGNVSMAIGPDGRRRGFAFVTMMEKDSYDGCLELDGKDVKGRDIKVNDANN